MMHRRKQAVAILLSLLLVFLPMQGAIAAVLSSDQPVEHSMMDMDHETAMSCCDGHEDCTANNTCSANDCTSGHCATCVAGILGDSKIHLNISKPVNYVSPNHSILSKSLSSLYRPPRA